MTVTNRGNGFIEAQGARLYYEAAGTGRPVLLLHAGIADHTMWDDQMEAFAASHRVVRFDMRGFGLSAMPPGPYSPEADLLALLDGLEIGRACLLGCSIGGRTALDFALAYPARVEALVLVGSGIGGFKFDSGALAALWKEIEDAYTAGDLYLATELETRMWVDGPGRAPSAVDPAVRAKAYAMNLRNNQLGESAGVPLPLEPPAIDRLNELRMPVLVLAGDQDVPQVLAQAEFLASHIGNARQLLIPGTAHLPNMEQPALFNRIVLEFLDALPITS